MSVAIDAMFDLQGGREGGVARSLSEGVSSRPAKGTAAKVKDTTAKAAEAAAKDTAAKVKATQAKAAEATANAAAPKATAAEDAAKRR